MPRLPDLTEDRKQIPQPSFGVVGYRPEKSTLESMGDQALDMAVQMRQEQEKIDKLAAEDALTRLREQQLNLTAGEGGYSTVMGEGAIKPDFYQNYSSKFDNAAKNIAQTLTPDQQNLFKPRASMVRLQYNEGVLRHAAQQGDQYAETTFKGIKAVETKSAETFWNNPNAVALSRERVDNSIDVMADRFGWSKDVKEATRLQAMAGIHAAVIERAMANGAYDYAKDWYETHKKELDPSVYEKIKKEQEAATFETRAFDAADAAIALADGDYNEALKEVRRMPDGKLAKEAAAEINRRQTDEMQAKAAMRTEYMGQGHLMIEQNSSLKNLKGSQAYRRLDAGGQAALLDAWHNQQRERRAEAEGLSAQPTKEQWEHYADLVTLSRDDPEKFRQLDIKSELWKVPKSLRDNVMTMWSKKPDENKVESTISYSQQMGAATRGMDKAKRGMFESAVQQEVMALETATGKKATATETQQIIDRLQINRDLPWYKGGDKPSYTLSPTQRQKYEPVISKEDRAEILERFMQRGNDNPTEEEIMNIYRKWKGL